jgi:hypothetical protein
MSIILSLPAEHPSAANARRSRERHENAICHRIGNDTLE